VAGRTGSPRPPRIEKKGSIDPDGVVDAGFSTPLTLVERADGVATYAATITRPEDDKLG